MSSFQFENILPMEQLDSSKNLLWIWHATKIPPHIGVSSDGCYFSLKVSGKDVDLNVDKVMALAQSKSIAMICVELKHEFSTKDLNRIFGSYSMAASDAATCLSPIKDLLELPIVRQLSELLQKLEENNTLGGIFGMNLPSDYERIPKYSSAEIQQRLIKLENAQRKTSLS